MWQAALSCPTRPRRFYGDTSYPLCKPDTWWTHFSMLGIASQVKLGDDVCSVKHIQTPSVLVGRTPTFILLKALLILEIRPNTLSRPLS